MAKGIEGKKGVLWWQIRDILEAKKTAFVLLENVDRLVKSPAKQRGRDFGIMLRCLSDLGYLMEWRIINAADYGHPQRRRRIFIFAYHQGTAYYRQITGFPPAVVMQREGLFAKRFPIEAFDVSEIKEFNVKRGFKDLVEVSDNFIAGFENAGMMIKGKVWTVKVKPIFEDAITLRQIVETNADASFYLNETQQAKFEYLRGSKRIPRTDDQGHEYFYSEGAMSPYDDLDLPARTMLTSEGTVNRSTHIINDPKTNRLRFLTPKECERINQFPDDWTNVGMPQKRRYFMMGNALVTGIIYKIVQEIELIVNNEP